MQITRHIDVTPNNISNFIEKCRKMHVHNFTTSWDAENKIFHCTMVTNENYYDAVMTDLFTIACATDNYELKDSLNCAIACIKTLIDMEVIN